MADVPRYFFENTLPGDSKDNERTMLTQKVLLNLPIAELNASPELQTLTSQYGYHTLADILKLPKAYDLLQHEGFGMRQLAELTHIMANHGLGQYLL